MSGFLRSGLIESSEKKKFFKENIILYKIFAFRDKELVRKAVLN